MLRKRVVPGMTELTSNLVKAGTEERWLWTPGILGPVYSELIWNKSDLKRDQQELKSWNGQQQNKLTLQEEGENERFLGSTWKTSQLASGDTAHGWTLKNTIIKTQETGTLQESLGRQLSAYSSQ